MINVRGGRGGRGRGRSSRPALPTAPSTRGEACEKAPACRGALVTPLWRSRNAVRDGHVTVVQRKNGAATAQTVAATCATVQATRVTAAQRDYMAHAVARHFCAERRSRDRREPRLVSAKAASREPRGEPATSRRLRRECWEQSAAPADCSFPPCRPPFPHDVVATSGRHRAKMAAFCKVRVGGLKNVWIITGYGLSQYGLSQV